MSFQVWNHALNHAQVAAVDSVKQRMSNTSVNAHGLTVAIAIAMAALTAEMALDKIPVQMVTFNPRDKTPMETIPTATAAAITAAITTSIAVNARMLITTKETHSAEALGVNKTR